MTDTVPPPDGAGAPVRSLLARAVERPVAWWRAGRFTSIFESLTIAGLLFVALVPLVGNELRVQDVDPVFMRNVVERASELGGTYYQNAIHNRGPLEPLLYDIAGRLVPYDAFWFVISAMAAAAAGTLAWAGARTARLTGANRAVAITAAAVIYVHFTMGRVGYAGVLYIRTITTVLLALVWIVALSESAWTTPARSRRTSIVIGALLGLLAQQLLTSVFAGAVVGLVALALLWERQGREEVLGHLRAAAVAGVVAFAATPAWYLARGSFHEYWSGWWTYARYMGDGPGRSLTNQAGLGWDRFYEYYGRNPSLVFLVGGFVALTWLLWDALSARERIVHAGLVAWLAAGWVELVLSQRYSSHYFAVIALPTALMGAAVAGHASRAIAARRPQLTVLAPAVVTVMAIFLTGGTTFGDAVKRTRDFRGFTELADERADALGGSDRSVRAVLDLVSHEQDGLLAWTYDPFVYSKFERIPATRFQWKSFLLGEIYLGRTRPEYILPDTWDWFAEDVAETDPVAFVETQDFASGTPFEKLIRTRFREVYPGPAAKVWLRDDVADELVDGPTDRPWQDAEERAGNSGWTVAGADASFLQRERPGSEDALFLASGPCVRVEGVLDVEAAGALADVLFRFESQADPNREPQFLALTGARAGSGSAGLGPTGFESVDANVSGDGPVRFAVVVGDRSAVLLVDGKLQGAVRLHRSVMRLTLSSQTPQLEVTDLRLGAAPTRGGCPVGD